MLTHAGSEFYPIPYEWALAHCGNPEMMQPAGATRGLEVTVGNYVARLSTPIFNASEMRVT